MRHDDLVLIAGGGPVGLLCTLLLGRRGLRVRLFVSIVARGPSSPTRRNGAMIASQCRAVAMILEDA